MLGGVLWSPLHRAPVARARRTVQVDRLDGNGSARVALLAGPELPGAVSEMKSVAAEYDHVHTLLPPGSTVDATVDLNSLASVVWHAWAVRHEIASTRTPVPLLRTTSTEAGG